MSPRRRPSYRVARGFRMLLANRICGGSGHRKRRHPGMLKRRRKAGGPGLRFRSFCQPGDEPRTIDGKGHKARLECGLRQPPIAGVAQIKAMNPLADHAFDPGPSLVALHEVLRFLAGACGVQGFVLRLGPQVARAWARGRLGTYAPFATGATRTPVKRDRDHRVPFRSVPGRPDPPGLTLRAAPLLLRPINRACGPIEPLSRRGVPPGSTLDGTKQVDPRGVAGYHAVRVRIRTIHTMVCRPQVACGHRLRHGLRHRPIGGRRGRGLASGDQVWPVRVTGRGQMHLGAMSWGIPLGAQPCIWGIGRANHACRWRQILGGTQLERGFVGRERLGPDLAQDTPSGVGSPHCRGGGDGDPGHPLTAISPKLQRQGLAFGGGTRQTNVVETLLIAHPPGEGDGAMGSSGSFPEHLLERRGQGFAQAFPPIEGTHGPQDVGRSGARSGRRHRSQGRSIPGPGRPSNQYSAAPHRPPDDSSAPRYTGSWWASASDWGSGPTGRRSGRAGPARDRSALADAWSSEPPLRGRITKPVRGRWAKRSTAAA